jgi:hypothetical protein
VLDVIDLQQRLMPAIHEGGMRDSRHAKFKELLNLIK